MGKDMSVTRGGGLGIRDLKTFKKALVMKMVWQMTSNRDTLWVEIMTAKYCHEGGLWGNNSTIRFSPLWKKIQQLKGEIKEDVCWYIGDGTRIDISNQPWCDGWTERTISPGQNRGITVSDLIDSGTGTWKEREIETMLGTRALQQILQKNPVPAQLPLLMDKLIWKPSTRGVYSTKEGYQLLRRKNVVPITYPENKLKAWRMIWKWRHLAPRVKTFLWRALHDGLATAMAMNRRIRAINPACQRCATENEYIMHLLFFCPASRAAWGVAPLPLRVEHLPLDFATTLIAITQGMDEQQKIAFCNL